MSISLAWFFVNEKRHLPDLLRAVRTGNDRRATASMNLYIVELLIFSTAGRAFDEKGVVNRHLQNGKRARRFFIISFGFWNVLLENSAAQNYLSLHSKSDRGQIHPLGTQSCNKYAHTASELGVLPRVSFWYYHFIIFHKSCLLAKSANE